MVVSIDLRSEQSGDTNPYLSGSLIKAKLRPALTSPSLSGSFHLRSYQRFMDSCQLWCHTPLTYSVFQVYLLYFRPRNVVGFRSCGYGSNI